MRRLLLVLTTGLFAFPLLHAQTAAGTPFFNYDPDTIVLEYNLEHGMIRHLDKTPLLTLRGDGLLTIHRPAFRRDAGVYQLTLTNAELQDLLQQLYQSGLFDFNATLIKREARFQASRAPLQVVSESEVSRFRVRLNQFQAPGETVFDDIDFEVAYENLAHEAQRFPQITALTALAQLQDMLSALAADEHLVKIAEVTP